MRPGSPERIAFYRQKAELEEPLFDDAPPGIPELPHVNPEFNRQKRIERPMNVEQAIDLLTADGAEELVDQQIAKHEAELAKLRKLKRIYTKSTQGVASNINEELEASIIKYVSKHGPRMPKDIAEGIGSSFMAVGKIVARSNKLTKQGAAVALAK